MESRELTIEVPEPVSDSVSALWLRPAGAGALLVCGHGAGAGMRHPFMEAVAERLAERRIATLRYQFPYMERGRKRPDRRPRLLTTVRAAVAAAHRLEGELPIFAGGKSMGGRMTSLAAAASPLPGVRGLVFFGFPLHAPGREPGDRADHLGEVDLPMLFLQGDRDRLARLELLRPLCERLADRATLHVVAGGDHSFEVLVRSGRTHEEALDELAQRAASWMRAV